MNENYKLKEKINRRGQAQTKADSELQPMFAGLAPFFANALLCARLMSSMHELKTRKCLNELQNWLLPFCKSKSLGIPKIASLTEMIRNIQEKVVLLLFELRTQECKNKFRFSVWIECIKKY